MLFGASCQNHVVKLCKRCNVLASNVHDWENGSELWLLLMLFVFLLFIWGSILLLKLLYFVICVIGALQKLRPVAVIVKEGHKYFKYKEFRELKSKKHLKEPLLSPVVLMSKITSSINPVMGSFCPPPVVGV